MLAHSGLICPLLSPSKIYLIPVEILSEIFLLMVESGKIDLFKQTDQENLMLVCQHWESIMLSTPGICSEVRIHELTEKEDVQAAMRGRRWLLDLSININTARIWTQSSHDDFHECFMAAAQEASQWRTLELILLPPPGVCEPVQILQPLGVRAGSLSWKGGGLAWAWHIYSPCCPAGPRTDWKKKRADWLKSDSRDKKELSKLSGLEMTRYSS
jgi:hypothetical protein